MNQNGSLTDLEKSLRDAREEVRIARNKRRIAKREVDQAKALHSEAHQDVLDACSKRDELEEELQIAKEQSRIGEKSIKINNSISEIEKKIEQLRTIQSMRDRRGDTDGAYEIHKKIVPLEEKLDSLRND